MHFYLVDNVNMRTQWHGVPYVHIKVKYDQSVVAIMTREPIPELDEFTQEQMQTELDAWITNENDSAISWWQWAKGLVGVQPPPCSPENPDGYSEQQKIQLQLLIDHSDELRWING